MHGSPPGVQMIKTFVRYLSLQTTTQHKKKNGRQSSLRFIAVGSISSLAGIMSCVLSTLEQPFLLLPGSPVVLPGGAERPHACLHLFLLAEPGSQQHRPQPFLLPSSNSPSAHSILRRGERAPVLTAPVTQTQAGRGWR